MPNPRNVRSRITKAHILVDNNDAQGALKLLNEPEEITPETLPLDLQMELAFVLAVAYLVAGEASKAVSPALHGIKLAMEQKNREMEARLRNELGIAYYVQGMYEQSHETYQPCLTFFAELDVEGKTPEPNLAFGICRNLGGACVELGLLDDGINYLNRAFDIAKNIADPQKPAWVKWNLSWAYYKKGDHNRAVLQGFAGIQILRKLGHDLLAIRLLAQVCVSLNVLGRYETAWESLRSCLQTAQEREDRQSIMLCYDNMAVVQIAQEDFDGALESLEKALNMLPADLIPLDCGQMWQHFATVYEKLGRIEDADAAYKAAGNDFKKAGGSAEIRQTSYNHAELWRKNGNIEKAWEILREGVAAGAME